MSTRHAEEHNPYVDLFVALDTSAYPRAAAPSAHTYIHALCQPDYYTLYSVVAVVVSARVEKHEKRELPVASPRCRRGNAANGRNQHQWPWQDLSRRFEQPPASSLLVTVGGTGPSGRRTKP